MQGLLRVSSEATILERGKVIEGGSLWARSRDTKKLERIACQAVLHPKASNWPGCLSLAMLAIHRSVCSGSLLILSNFLLCFRPGWADKIL
jgi:hypothetical protein